MNQKLIFLTSFICGGSVMILELLASRLLSPYVGSTNVIWTIIIGLMLAGMSFGYYLGGKIADRRPRFSTLSYLIAIAVLFLSLIPLLETIVLAPLSLAISLKLTAFISTAIIFGPACILLAAVSPFLIKLAAARTNNLGQIAGQISAWNAGGSIVGTFSAGFLLLPYLGSKNTLAAIIIILLILTFTLSLRHQTILKILLALVSLIIFLIGIITFNTANPQLLADIDTQYQRAWVLHGKTRNDVTYRLLKIGQGYQSGVYFGSSYMFDYLSYFDLFSLYSPQATNVLLVGGAGLRYPTHFVQTFPHHLTVVELDPQLTQLALKYFNYQPHERITIIHDDGRSYLTHAHITYDAIFLDAFSSSVIPLNLITKEAFQVYAQSLAQDGTLIINVIGSLEGEHAHDLQSIITTAATVFPTLKLFQVNSDRSPQEFQNFILLARHHDSPPVSISGELQNLLTHEIPLPPPADLLTDDQAIYDLS